jgi:glycosyltransferase involved in cell wall biosynthesis
MTVKNEEHRYLKAVLLSARAYITDAVIIDDGSTDNTAALCGDCLKDIPHRIIRNGQSKFHNEWVLRRQQWEASVKDNPEWLLFLDADEVFEERFAQGVRALLDDADCYLYSFRLYDFWDETHYRDDALWRAHTVYRPFLLRYKSGFHYRFNQTEQHCGRMPANVFDLPNKRSDYRVKHFGWAKAADRIEKYNRYLELDPHGVFGSMAQYQSILDPNPNLVQWTEH